MNKQEHDLKRDKNLPQHVAIILDGNRRWAKSKGLSSLQGHLAGMQRVEKAIAYLGELGVKILTLYAFSVENWRRSQAEVGYLMNLFEKFLDKNLKKIKRQGVCFRYLGDLSKFPPVLKRKLETAVEQTKNNSKMVLNVALNYTGRDEIRRALQKIIKQNLKAEEINENIITLNLDTAGLPDPDLIIRTSGEQRLSGFLLWQAAYAEFYFTDVCWPDFDEMEIDKAVSEFQRRQRRFGK
jgi:undecaprenyl diphosphate synthase